MNCLKIKRIGLLVFSAASTLLSFSMSFAESNGAVEQHVFSLSNGNAYPIWVALFENENVIVPITKVQPREHSLNPAVAAAPDIRKSILLAVWFSEPENVEPKRNGKKVTPEPNQLYAFTPGKTLYLTWRNLGILSPKAGMFWGLKPESREGFNLDLNVEPSDIIQIKHD